MHLNLAYFGIESAVPIGNLALANLDLDHKVFRVGRSSSCLDYNEKPCHLSFKTIELVVM